MVMANATPGEVHEIILRNLKRESIEHSLRWFRLWIDRFGCPVAELRVFHKTRTQRALGKERVKHSFLKAIENVEVSIVKSDGQHKAEKEVKAEAARRRLYLHIKYQNQNLSAHQIHTLFSKVVLQPVQRYQ